jgi:elongation factor 1-gamma
VIGLLPFNAAASAKAKTDLARALGVLEAHLADKTYIVGHRITLADIVIVSALVYPFKLVADAAFRGPFPNVMRWFDTCVHQPAFENVIGSVVLATKEATPEGGAAAAAGAGAGKKEKAAQAPKEKKEKAPKAEKPKEEPKPKEEKKKAKKDDDDDDAPEPDFVQEKKAEHPFKILDKTNPTPFVMDTWKKTYSNAKDYNEAMDYFWANIDAAGWSIFRGDYQYNDELQILFMTSNLIAGFIQRTDEIRKWLFGTMTIRGVERQGMKVTAYYLIRGDSIQPLIDCNDDAACYTWTKMPIPASAEDKKLLFDYWTSDGPLEGEACLDSRCYK